MHDHHSKRYGCRWLGWRALEADVAIDGRITAVGHVSGRGREEVEAKGKIVAPALST
jgi:N-acyl-D-aspartate/D-glutamate deacylase